MGTLELRSELHKPGQKSLSWPQGQRMLLVRRAGGSGNCVVVQKRCGFPEDSAGLYAEKVATRGLCAIAQAESLRYKLLGGLAV